MKSFVGWVVMLAALCTPTLGGAQDISSTAKRLLPGEITWRTAHSAGSEAIRKLTGPSVTFTVSSSLLRVDVYGRRFWDIDGKPYSVKIDSGTGKLISAYNQWRVHDQFRKKNRTGKVLYKTEREWRGHLTAIARRMGVPASATMTGYSGKRDGQVRDANKSGEITCTFSDRGKRIAVINCDPQDGVVIYFGWR